MGHSLGLRRGNLSEEHGTVRPCAYFRRFRDPGTLAVSHVYSRSGGLGLGKGNLSKEHRTVRPCAYFRRFLVPGTCAVAHCLDIPSLGLGPLLVRAPIYILGYTALTFLPF